MKIRMLTIAAVAAAAIGALALPGIFGDVASASGPICCVSPAHVMHEAHVAHVAHLAHLGIFGD